MWVEVLKPFYDLHHGRKLRAVKERYNEKVIRANDLAEAGWVKKVSKKKASGS